MSEQKSKTAPKAPTVSRKRDRTINRRKARNARRAAAKAKLADARKRTREARRNARETFGVTITAREARQHSISGAGMGEYYIAESVWTLARERAGKAA